MEILKRLALILALFACVAGIRSATVHCWRKPCDMPPTPDATRTERIAKLVIFTSDSCHWCERLKADWPEGFPVAHEWNDDPQEARKHRVSGLPTLILFDESGREIDRKVGYVSKPELARWLDRDDDGHIPDSK